jgi:tRNA pseudouridine32 synthase / 23S rRNA pseudouridine746 synthase
MNQSSIALKASKVWLPDNKDFATIFDFLCDQFPTISQEIWQQRVEEGKVTIVSGDLVSLDTPYKPCHVNYFRELKQERPVPFQEEILYEDENILVVDKPHFLTVHPVGQYINETLLNRLKLKTGNNELLGAHRLDRLTAGLVLFSKKKESRGKYQQMFADKVVEKTYEAIGPLPETSSTEWLIENRLVSASEPWFLMEVSGGVANTETSIKLIEQSKGFGRFELKPITGKKHQLRVHMGCIGSRVLNDPFYPEFQKNVEDDFENPLKLLAKKLAFTDPLTEEFRSFESKQFLNF